MLIGCGPPFKPDTDRAKGIAGVRDPGGLLMKLTGLNLTNAARPFPDILVKTMREQEFQVFVINLARQLGWYVYHTHDSRGSEAGFPDLTLVRDQVLLFAELKRESGRVTAAQQRVHRLFEGAGHPVLVWRPSDWPAVVETLNDPAGVIALEATL